MITSIFLKTRFIPNFKPHKQSADLSFGMGEIYEILEVSLVYLKEIYYFFLPLFVIFFSHLEVKASFSWRWGKRWALPG